MKKLAVILIGLYSCSKSTNHSPEPKLAKCTNWVGTWFCFDGDSIMKDSLVIEVKEWTQGYVQYKCNVSELDSLLKHPCPYKATSDDIHIVYKGKNMYFRYVH